MPDLISARELPDAISSAVKLASSRLNVPGEPSKIIVRWDLIGRILRDFETANKFADTVAGELKAGGIAVEPAVLRINKKIIAGFFERGNIPQVRNI